MKDSKFFDINSYNQYINNNDYIGAASYLRGFVWKDKAKQQTIDNSIRTFEHEGRIRKAIYDRGNDLQKKALSFYNSINSGGNLPNEQDNKGNYTNPYTQRYVKAINDFGGKGTTNILVKFNPRVEKRYGIFGWDWTAADEDMGEDGYTLFSKTIGMDEKALRNAGVNITRDRDGNVIMDIAKNNKLTPKIMQALYHTTSNYSSVNPNMPKEKDGDSSAIKRFYIEGYNSGNSSSKTNAIASLQDADSTFEKWVGNQTWTGAKLTDITKVLNDAKEKQDEVVKSFKKSVTTQSIVANYLGQDDLMAKNSNNPTIIKSVKDGYDMRLMGTSFDSMNVYSNVELNDDGKVDDVSDDSTTLKTVSSVKQRTALHSLITGQINNVSYSAAMVGDKVGTMITVPEKRDDKGNLVTPMKQVFVENLFRSEAEDSFNNDTALRAQREYATMQKYEYDYDVADYNAKGRKARIYGADDTGAWYDNGVDNPYRIDKNEAMRLINKQFIINDGATNLQRSFTNPDGSPRNNTLFMQQLDNYTKQAVSELEPEAFRRVAESYQRTGDGTLDNQGTLDYDYYKRRQAELSSFILNEIGFTD